MKHEQFVSIFDEVVAKSERVLVEKGAEYAPHDRLHNFRIGANLQAITMKQCLAGYMAKHTVSIYDMIASDENYSIEKWDEKILDHINYLILLRAIVCEEKEAD